MVVEPGQGADKHPGTANVIAVGPEYAAFQTTLIQLVPAPETIVPPVTLQL